MGGKSKTLPTTVVFDLDGTLFDTAPDLVVAANHVLAMAGGEAVELNALRPMVSFGGREMIRKGLKLNGLACDDKAVDALFPEFIEYYTSNIAVHTRAFPGLITQLETLMNDGKTIAICTNKLEEMTWPLLRELGLEQCFSAVTGRDTFPVCKPDPRHLLGTIARAGGDPARSVMVGDSNTDIQTAKAAGVPVIGVTFGYTDVPVTELGCNGIISHYDEFPAVLKRLATWE